jgi:hypothetical protein
MMDEFAWNSRDGGKRPGVEEVKVKATAVLFTWGTSSNRWS